MALSFEQAEVDLKILLATVSLHCDQVDLGDAEE